MSAWLSAPFPHDQNAALVSLPGFANLEPKNKVTIKDVGKGTDQGWASRMNPTRKLDLAG